MGENRQRKRKKTIVNASSKGKRRERNGLKKRERMENLFGLFELVPKLSLQC
jgi:hypothetical protein